MRAPAPILLATTLMACVMGGRAAAQTGDTAQTQRSIEQAAEHGDANAQLALARFYSRGVGEPVDLDKAALWFRKAADQGNAEAEFNLGLCYQNGLGLAHDSATAALWYRKAAQGGNAAAAVRLAAMYADGEGVAKDTVQAAAWYRRAADLGDPDATFDLALMRARTVRPIAGAPTTQQFHAMMDTVFGLGRWRETSGFRTVAEENRLRADGALTVSAGELSRHSMGTPNAPDAYDIVVPGLSPEQAAEVLRRSGYGFRRLFPETSHGDQGPHLHIEPLLSAPPRTRLQWPPTIDTRR